MTNCPAPVNGAASVDRTGGGSTDPKAGAASRFAVQVVRARGHVTDTDGQAVHAGGENDAHVTEIALHVALNTLISDVNNVAKTPSTSLSCRIVRSRVPPLAA
jgi:hypothetical protein